MRTRSLVVAAVGLFLLGADEAADDASKAEFEKLAGSWTVLNAEVGGKEADKSSLGIEELVIAPGKLTVRHKGKDVMTFLVKLDPTKDPKHMDWSREKGGQPLPCIYELKNFELRLCFPMIPKKPTPDAKLARPASFDTKDKPVAMLLATPTKSE